jgi:putative Mg2+ transporter-C (MgtC) family protein
MTYHQVLYRLLFASLMGAIIGIERDIHHHPAGVRTSLFICLGSALFTILSVEFARVNGGVPTQIASNIITGVGFLGAGAIIRSNAGIIGMTTAATVFVEAAIGMAIGTGFYAIGATTTAIVLFGLIVLFWGEKKFIHHKR